MNVLASALAVIGAMPLLGMQTQAQRPRLLWESDAVLLRVVVGAVDRCGRLVLVDRGEAAPQRFDTQGRRMGAIGRAGDGPMEFRAVAGLGFRGDTLWISDRVRRRVTLLPPTPAPVLTGSIVHQSVTRGGRKDLRFDDATPSASLGGRWVLPVRTAFRAQSVRTAGEVAEHHILLQGRGAARHDTLAVLQLPHSTMWFAGKDAAMLLVQPFADDPLLSVASNDRFAVVLERPAGGAMQLTWWSGSTLSSPRTQALAIAPRMLTKRRADAVALQTIRAAGNQTLGFDLADSMRKKFYVPRHVPSVSAVTVAQDGSVWVRTSGMTGADALWLVVSAAGGVVSQVTLPARFRLLDTDGLVLWGVMSGEDDEETLVAYAVGAVPTGWSSPACRTP